MAAGLTNTTMTMMILIHVEVNSSLGQLASWHANKEIVSFHCKLYYILGHKLPEGTENFHEIMYVIHSFSS